MAPSLRYRFGIRVSVDAPILVGRDEKTGRRQLIPILSGEVSGENGLHGTVLPGGVDCQVIRPDGRCEVSARYAVRLDNGDGFYIQNDGVRTVPPDYARDVFDGKFVDPDLYYFCTTPRFEVFSGELAWLLDRVFICSAKRLPDAVLIDYYSVEI